MTPELTDEVRHRVLWEEGVSLFRDGSWTYGVFLLGLSVRYTRDPVKHEQYEKYRKEAAWNAVHAVDR